MKIFAPSPRIYPSVLNSRAGAATEFAKPVMGTSVPAPACFAMRSYQPRPVRRPIKISKLLIPTLRRYPWINLNINTYP